MNCLLPLLCTLLLPPATGPQDEDVERLDAWPALERADRARAKADVARVRKAHTPEMAEQGHDALVAAGAGVAPLVLDGLGKEQDPAASGRLVDVLDLVTGAAHTRLLAAEFSHESREVRLWSLRRAAWFPDAGTRAAADAALARARKPGRRKAPDPDELRAAALAATAAGSLEGLDTLVAAARSDWATEGAAIHVAGTAVRGTAATRTLLPLVRSDERGDVLAGLYLLAACGTKEDATEACAAHLDSSDTVVRIAAINALRGIVDGDPPLPRLSAFDAIELAQEWKRRVR